MSKEKKPKDDGVRIDRDDLDEVLMEAARLQMESQDDGKVTLNSEAIDRIAASTGITKELLLKAHGSVERRERRQRQLIALGAGAVLLGALVATPMWWEAVFPPDPVARSLEAEDLRKKAVEARKDGSHNMAIRHARKAVNLAPDNYRAWNVLALSYQDNGQYAEARQAYLTAIDKGGEKPDAQVLYYNMGAFLATSPEHRGEALGYYRKALAIDPNYSQALNNMGWTYEQMGESQEAIAHYRKALKADPNNQAASDNLDRLEQKLGIRKPVKLDAVKAGVLNRKGDTYYSAKDYKAAIKYYREALAHNPKDFAGWNDLGLAYENDAQAEEAIKAFKEGMRVGGYARDNCYNYYNLARLMDNAQENEEAIRLYREAIKCKPEYTGALNNLGTVYEELDRFDEAIAVYKRAIEVDPNYARAKNNLEKLERRLANGA